MVYNKPYTMMQVSIFLIALILLSAVPKPAGAYHDADLIQPPQIHPAEQTSGLIRFQQPSYESTEKRYLVFGPGPVSGISQRAENLLYGLGSGHGSFAVGMFKENEVASLKLAGYDVIQDLPLEFDSASVGSAPSDVSKIDDILGTSKVIEQYNYTGEGIRIGIVDTGTDFSNPDVTDSVARDGNHIPVMIDADGQGLLLTNSTFVAQI